MKAICKEFKLHVIVHDLEDVNHNSKYRVNKKNYFGDLKTEAFNEIHINSYKDHYFLEEKTKYTRDYIKRKYVLHEEVDPNNFNKRFDGGYWNFTDSRRVLFSCGIWSWSLHHDFMVYCSFCSVHYRIECCAGCPQPFQVNK